MSVKNNNKLSDTCRFSHMTLYRVNNDNWWRTVCFIRGWNYPGVGVQPAVDVYTDAHFLVKIGFKFQSLCKISNTSTFDPPSSFRLIPTLTLSLLKVASILGEKACRPKLIRRKKWCTFQATITTQIKAVIMASEIPFYEFLLGVGLSMLHRPTQHYEQLICDILCGLYSIL